MSNTSEVKKASKPFCSLAYLAKSTAAINGGSNDIRIVNGATNSNKNKNNDNNGERSLTPTTTPTTTGSSDESLTTTSRTTSNGDHYNNNRNYDRNYIDRNKKQEKSDNLNDNTDIFGIINEEDQLDSSDNSDLRRPWEFSNTYLKRVPSALMTNGLNGGPHATQQHYFYNGQNNHNVNNSGSCLTSLSKLNSLDCWDYTIELECLKGPQDLQLAAELGKTLLERNKELETLLKEHKNVIEEQEQEIVYLKKHTTALREVNDSRLKVYEQLEVGIQDLERANHRLLVENTSDKKHIKTLVLNVENLESRCDELNKQLEDSRQALNAERRKNDRLVQEKNTNGSEGLVRLRTTADHFNRNGDGNNTSEDMAYEGNNSGSENCSFAFQSPTEARNSTGISSQNNDRDSGDRQSDMNLIASNGMTGLEGEENEEIMKIVNDLEFTKKAYMAEQQRCAELEEQLGAIIQENKTLQCRIAQSSANEEMRSMHEELSILDEVRQGQMCSRCLRAIDDRATLNDEQSSLAPTEEVAEEDEDEERSKMDFENSNADGIMEAHPHETDDHAKSAYRSSVSIKVENRVLDSLDLNTPGMHANSNPYRDLVEKYEALLEVQRTSAVLRKSNSHNFNNSSNNNRGGLSIAEEFQTMQNIMIEAVAATSAHGEGASSSNGSMTNEVTTGTVGNEKSTANNNAAKGGRGRTPCEFSEAETSSSGFSDETSNKGTQTDDRPGYFLCSIGDGEDCKFSIYDDVSPIDSRFRNRPEYRELFKEIFAVLKKAAENKEEGDKLPLLDDTHPIGPIASKVPPVTPANEEPPMDFGDDSQSIISSAVSEQSFAMSECITKLERKSAKKHIIEKNHENNPPLLELETSLSQLAMTGAVGVDTTPTKSIIENGRVLTPLKREPLEYLMVGVGVKKKGRNRKNRNFSNDRSESPVALPSPPRFFVGSGKKRRPINVHESPVTTTGSNSGCGTQTPTRSTSNTKFEWNGSSMVIYNRGVNQRARNFEMGGIEYRPSTVSQDLHKLKKLDLSYAEVLRRADSCKHHHQTHSYQSLHTPSPSPSPAQSQSQSQSQTQQPRRRNNNRH